MIRYKYIALVVIFLIGGGILYAQNNPKTKIRLFDQTTDFDTLFLKQKNPCFKDVRQISHGLSMLGVNNNIPFPAFINASGQVEVAMSNSPENKALGIAYVLDANNLRYYVCDQLINAPFHGLTIGAKYYLTDAGLLDVVPGSVPQLVFEVVTTDYLNFLKFPQDNTCIEPPLFTQLPPCGPGVFRNFFNEAQFAWGFSIQNSNNFPIAQWQIIIRDADYTIDFSMITNNGEFSYAEVDNGDGTYDLVFTSTGGLPAFGSTSNFEWPGVNFGYNPTSTAFEYYCN